MLSTLPMIHSKCLIEVTYHLIFKVARMILVHWQSLGSLNDVSPNWRVNPTIREMPWAFYAKWIPSNNLFIYWFFPLLIGLCDIQQLVANVIRLVTANGIAISWSSNMFRSHFKDRWCEFIFLYPTWWDPNSFWLLILLTSYKLILPAALMYVLVPMPCLFFGGGSTQFLTSRDGGGLVFLNLNSFNIWICFLHVNYILIWIVWNINIHADTRVVIFNTLFSVCLSIWYRSWIDAAKFLTGASAVGSMAIPIILRHAQMIQTGAMLIEFTSFFIFVCTVMCFHRASLEDEW